MNDFRIFCELLTKMMLESIDFTDVLEVYNGNEQPEKQGIITHVCIHGIPSIHIYKKESLRNWVV